MRRYSRSTGGLRTVKKRIGLVRRIAFGVAAIVLVVTVELTLLCKTGWNTAADAISVLLIFYASVDGASWRGSAKIAVRWV